MRLRDLSRLLLCRRFLNQTSRCESLHQEARELASVMDAPCSAAGVGRGAAQAQQYTKIVVFGDSLSDTGNDAVLAFFNFTFRSLALSRITRWGASLMEPDTLPPALNYFGVWVEQLAAALPAHPTVVASLQGGTNYAFGFAKTGSGTTLLTFAPGFSIEVENVGQQIDDYLAPIRRSTTIRCLSCGRVRTMCWRRGRRARW